MILIKTLLCIRAHAFIYSLLCLLCLGLAYVTQVISVPDSAVSLEKWEQRPEELSLMLEDVIFRDPVRAAVRFQSSVIL